MSSKDFSVSITFLTGRYHGDEWPPSPARLFQAFVAGVMTCGYSKHAEAVEPALRWLEKQAPPLIKACSCQRASEYRIAVPNNDMDVVAWKSLQGRYLDPAVLKTMKSIRPWQVDSDGPHLKYVWRVESQADDPPVGALRLAAHCLHTLGWGVDMAFADPDDKREPGDVFKPTQSGNRLSVPTDGTLDDLRSVHARFAMRTSGRGVDTYTQPTVFRMQPYGRVGNESRPVAQFALTELNTDRTASFTWQECMKVAGWLRHAAAERLRPEYPTSFIEEYVQGHTRSEEKSTRLSYVPLPSIYRYGDGRIRRVLIGEPPNATGEVARMLELKLTGRELFDKDGKPICCLGPADSADWTFEQYLPRKEMRVWTTVTPVVLHGYNVSGRGVISVGKTERLLLRAFSMAGYGEENIEGFTFQAGPLWPGTGHAYAIYVPDHLQRYPRMHVEVRFKRGVRGPVLAGIGRHYGIGLFAAVGE